MRLVLLLIVFCVGPLVLLLLPKIDAHPRVDGSEWRVRPSRSGKTWEAYRYAGGIGMEQKRTRFKSREAAEEWVRLYGNHVPRP